MTVTRLDLKMSPRASTHNSTHNEEDTFDDVDQDSFSLCTILVLAGVGVGVLATALIVVVCCVCAGQDSPELKSTCKAYAAADKTRKCPASKPQLLEQVKCLLQKVDESSPDKGLKQCADFENVCCEKAATGTPSEATSEPVDTTACPAAIQSPAQWAATLAPEGSLEGSIQRSGVYSVMLESIQKAVQEKV